MRQKKQCPSLLAKDFRRCERDADHKGKCREVIPLADKQDIVVEWWFRKAK